MINRGRPKGLTSIYLKRNPEVWLSNEEWQKKHPRGKIATREKKLAYDRAFYKKWYATGKRKNIELNKQQAKERKFKQKIKILTAYSNGKIKCSCCGETEIKFLTLDHLNGNGSEHRAKFGGSSGVYVHLIKNNFPDKQHYRVLCFNCNTTNGQYGECPHEEARRKAMAMFI